MTGRLVPGASDVFPNHNQAFRTAGPLDPQQDAPPRLRVAASVPQVADSFSGSGVKELTVAAGETAEAQVQAWLLDR